MNDRLIELIKAYLDENVFIYPADFDTEYGICCEHLADHLLADGVIVLPAKVGDTVWSKEAEPYKVISVEWFSMKVTHLHCVSLIANIRHTFSVGKRSLGKTVFLTREEAERALKEKQKE